MPFNVISDDDIRCFSTMRKYKGSSLLDTHQIDYIIRIFPLQVSLVCVMTAVIQLLLKPLGETPVVALIMSGILIGPSGLGRFLKFRKVVFPTPGGRFLVDTLGNFGCMFYIFLIGVKMNLSILKRLSKKERAIGILTFILPMLFTVPPAYVMQNVAPGFFAEKMNIKIQTIENSRLIATAVMSSTSSFHVIACFLTDLKILNTELGRIATSASTISGMCSLIITAITFAMRNNELSGGLTWLEFMSSGLMLIIFIIVVLRTIVVWMIKRTPQGEQVKDIYVFSILIMVLGTGLMGEISGHHFIFGPMILGLAIPNGPPVGSSLMDKLDTFTSAVLLPLYFCNIGNQVDLVLPQRYNSWTVIPLCFLGFLGKLIGTLIAGLFYQVPFEDALMLGLSLSTLGILDVHNYRGAMTYEVITQENFTIMVMSALSLAGVIAPIVHFFYNPARRYIINKKRTIQHLKSNVELRILACIYNDENVPTIVNILQASNPTKESPIIIYLLHLIELVGRSTPLLMSHMPNGNYFDNPSPSDRIINSFKIFEKKYQGTIVLHPFTSMAPLLSAQEDICTLAFDKRACLIIIPFHKQWTIDGTTQTSKWRNTNKKLLRQAPCSVGILIDRGVLNGSRYVLSNWSTYNIAIIYLGDADDREALCYGMRMAENPKVYLTVYRLILIDYMGDDVTEKILDENVINDFKLINKDIERNMYIEEMVKDGVEMINVIRSMEKAHDLILVGRSHSSYYNIFSDFMEWNEYPELGFFGDILASSDFNGKASVLIVQQHSYMKVDLLRNEKDHSYTSDTWK